MNNPCYSTSCPVCSIPNLYALDTETTRFNEPVLAWKGKTRIKPFGGHTLVLGSICGSGKLEVYHRANFTALLADLLSNPANEFVFHNAAFDIPVLCAAEPALQSLFNSAIDQNRVHDTKILEVLLQIAVGSRTMSQKQLVSSPSLKDLSQKRASITLSKDPSIRLGFDKYLDPYIPIPEESLRYAAEDARATYLVYRAQLSEANLLHACYNGKFPRFSDCITSFGLLSESVQVQGSIAFAWLEQFPLRIDQQKVLLTRNHLESEIALFEEALISYEWGSRTKRTKKFSCRFTRLRKDLLEFAKLKQIIPEYSPTGKVSLSHDFWTKHLPKIDKALYAAPKNAATLIDRLTVWLRYIRARKLLSTYIYIYAASERHYPEYQNIGARTGRVSCHRPNVMNIPKRRDGIRAIFIPEPGHVFLEADWDFAELVTLAQIYHELYGTSPLEDAINSGQDPHIATARSLIENYDTLSPDLQKKYRQSAKAVNFGLPGGLGAETFRKYAESSFGVSYTLEEAKLLRRRALSSNPQLAAYLSEKYTDESYVQLISLNLSLPVSRLIALTNAYTSENRWDFAKCKRELLKWVSGNNPSLTIPVPPGCKNRLIDLRLQSTTTLTGRLRGKSTFTAAHNTPFQGLVADAGKIALWLLYKNFQTRPIFQPVAFIHDSILVQCLPENLSDTKSILESAMLTALKKVCPTIKCGVSFTECGARWGTNTNPWGEEL